MISSAYAVIKMKDFITTNFSTSVLNFSSIGSFGEIPKYSLFSLPKRVNLGASPVSLGKTLAPL